MFESAVPPSFHGPCRPPASDPRWALVAATLGSSMAFLDGTVVNVALPIMQRDLDASVELVQWIVEAYSLFLASLVLVGGALGDRFGRRRVFVIGTVVFAAASVACGAAPGALALVGARAVQGVGAAFLVPGSLSLISAAYPDRKARAAAIGTWSAWSAITSSAGPIAGGWVVEHASWRWLFSFNIPVAVAVVAVSLLRVAETRDETAPHAMDWSGSALATIGLGCLVYGLLDSEVPGGLGKPVVILCLAAGVLCLAAFAFVETRVVAPMVPPSLFSSKTFLGANILTMFLYAALGGALFFVPFNLIQVQAYPPAAAGAALLPFVVLISLMSRWVGGKTEKWGARRPLVIGPALASAGFGLLSMPSIGGPYWTTFFPGIVVLGLGMGVTVAPLTSAVMGSVDPSHAGVASGVNNAVSRAAGLLAIGVLGVLLFATFNRALDRELADLGLPPDVRALVDAQRGRLAAPALPPSLDGALAASIRSAFGHAYVSGFRALMITSAGLSILGAVAAAAFVEPRVHVAPAVLGAASGERH